MLAALHFVQSELAEVKQTISSTIEEVHSIREMCERPLPASAPQYRAPHFAAQIPGPAPLYEAAASSPPMWGFRIDPDVDGVTGEIAHQVYFDTIPAAMFTAFRCFTGECVNDT
ncbi:hypothetical protein AK812_SmicGene46239, partial [Symbiodinium microadriaticum]